MPNMVCWFKHAVHDLQEAGRDGMSWQRSDFEMFCAILPSSLQALDFGGYGRASLPDLKHLTALTALRLDWAYLNPARGQLPRLPALRLLSFVGADYAPCNQVAACYPGPKDLGLCAFNSTPC